MVEREVKGAESRKRLSEEGEEGSDSYSRPFQVGTSRSSFLPHPLADLPSSSHVNTIIPSVLCSYFHIRAPPRYATSHSFFTSFTYGFITSGSFLTFHLFPHHLCVFVSKFSTLHPCSYTLYTPRSA